MPFITEEIWQAMYNGEPELRSIAKAPYPELTESQVDMEVEHQMAILQDLIVSVRNLRAELKVEQKLKVPIQVFAHDPETRRLIEQNRDAIYRLANVESTTEVEQSIANQPPSRSTTRFDVRVVYEKKIDLAAERERLTKNWRAWKRNSPMGRVNWTTSSFEQKLQPRLWKEFASGCKSWRF